METWMTLQLPAALVLYSIALFLCLFEKRYHATHGLFHWLSAVCAVLGCGCSLLYGASLRECAGALLVFLLLNMEIKV